MIASPFTFISRPGLDRPAFLTPAEQALLPHLLAGFSNKEIAAALHKAEPTVKHQVSSILQKHRVPSRARLIALLHPPPSPGSGETRGDQGQALPR